MNIPPLQITQPKKDKKKQTIKACFACIVASPFMIVATIALSFLIGEVIQYVDTFNSGFAQFISGILTVIVIFLYLYVVLMVVLTVILVVAVIVMLIIIIKNKITS